MNIFNRIDWNDVFFWAFLFFFVNASLGLIGEQDFGRAAVNAIFLIWIVERNRVGSPIFSVKRKDNS